MGQIVRVPWRIFMGIGWVYITTADWVYFHVTNPIRLRGSRRARWALYGFRVLLLIAGVAIVTVGVLNA